MQLQLSQVIKNQMFEGYVLVKPAEGVRDTQTLRSGDQVIATSGELHDGKVIR